MTHILTQSQGTTLTVSKYQSISNAYFLRYIQYIKVIFGFNFVIRFKEIQVDVKKTVGEWEKTGCTVIQ